MVKKRVKDYAAIKKLITIGNNMGVTIPKEIAEASGSCPGDRVAIKIIFLKDDDNKRLKALNKISVD